MSTWIIVVQTPCLDVVLSQFSVSQQLYGVWHQLHIVLGKLLKLQVHPTNLEQQTFLVLPKKKQLKINTQQKKNLGIKRIIVKQISTMECFAVGLVKSYHVLLSSEYFNLKIYIYEEFVKENIHFDLICCLWTTSGEGSLFSD